MSVVGIAWLLLAHLWTARQHHTYFKTFILLGVHPSFLHFGHFWNWQKELLVCTVFLLFQACHCTTHQQPASNLVTVYILPPWAMLYFKSQLFICVPPALTSIFVTGNLYIFHMGLRINTDYFPKHREPVFIFHKNAMCFLVSENQF